MIVISIFGVVISQVFTGIFSDISDSSMIQIPIAIWLGYQVYKKNKSLIFGLIKAVLLMYLSIVLGINYPIEFNSKYLSSDTLWVIILLAYAFISSILPVSVLLQPRRDCINAFQLIIAIAFTVEFSRKRNGSSSFKFYRLMLLLFFQSCLSLLHVGLFQVFIV